MSWIISILIVIYTIVLFVSLVICDENNLLDFYWNEYNIFERIMLVIFLINIGIICIASLCAVIWGVHYILMEIPQFKELIIRMEWN